MDLAPASRGVSPLRHAPCLGLSPPTPSLETPRTGNCLPSISTDEEFGHGCLAGLGAVLTRWGAAFPTSRNETSGHLRLSAMADVAGLPSITLAQSCQTPLGKHGAKRCAHTRLHKKKNGAPRRLIYFSEKEEKTALRAAITFHPKPCAPRHLLRSPGEKRRSAPLLQVTIHKLRRSAPPLVNCRGKKRSAPSLYTSAQQKGAARRRSRFPFPPFSEHRMEVTRRFPRNLNYPRWDRGRTSTRELGCPSLNNRMNNLDDRD